MNILITGGTGLIGSALVRQLKMIGHHIIIYTRQPSKVAVEYGAISDFEQLKSDTQIDAIINLSGESIIDKAWTDKRKQVLLDSRVGVTQDLYQFVKRLDSKPRVLISGSAVGYYGNHRERTMTEKFQFDAQENTTSDFAQSLCFEWEQAANQFAELGIRVCCIRLGLVISPLGGMIKSMKLPFKLGLGAAIAPGNQWMSWIHIDDVVKAIIYLLNIKDRQSVYNLTAPNPVTNQEFSKKLATSFNRPLLFKAPKFMIKLALGERSQLLLGGQKVLPERLLEEGFEFQFSDIESAFATIV